MKTKTFCTVLGEQELAITYQVVRKKILVDEIKDEYGDNVMKDMPKDLLNYIESKCSTHHSKECLK